MNLRCSFTASRLMCAMLAAAAFHSPVQGAGLKPGAATPPAVSATPVGAGDQAQVDLTGVWINPDGPPMPIEINDMSMMKPWVAAEVTRRRAAQAAGNPIPSNIAKCQPTGMPKFLQDAHGLQIIQTPQQIVFLGEQDHNIRNVYMDETHPADLKPTWAGHSVGHWDGDVLTIDTVGLNQGYFDLNAPHSEALHIVERFRLLENGMLEVAVSLDDHLALNRPWNYVKRYQRDKDRMHILEYACAENNRD